MSLLRPRTRAKAPNSAARMVVGLRNPGPDYAGTRHNLGHEVLLRAVERAGGRMGRAPSRVRCELAETGAGDDRVFYVAPLTYMNDSGGAIRAAVDYYRVDLDRLLVLHDDIDLGFGRFRLQVAGGSGGHNGIRSLERSLGSKDFNRLKLGVGRPPGSQDPADFVLRSFSRSERPEVDSMVEEAADVVAEWLINPARAQEMAARRGAPS